MYMYVYQLNHKNQVQYLYSHIEFQKLYISYNQTFYCYMYCWKFLTCRIFAVCTFIVCQDRIICFVMVKLGWVNFCFQLQLILYIFFFNVGQRARDPQGSIWILLGTFSVITLTFCCGRKKLHVPGISWTEGFLHPIQRCKAADFFHKTCTICFIHSVYIHI